MKISVDLFGGPGDELLGVRIAGLPAGLPVEPGALRAALSRRVRCTRALLPGERISEPVCRIAAGAPEGETTGAPVVFFYGSVERREPGVLRPSTGDLGAFLRGERFESRMGELDRLCGLTLAGELAREAALSEGVTVLGHLLSAGGVEERSFERQRPTPEELEALSSREPAVFLPETAEAMGRAVRAALERGDTVGGMLELVALGLPGGLGSDARPVQAEVARALFELPYVAGVSFGRGEALVSEPGHRAVDRLRPAGGRVRSEGGGFGGLCGPFTSGEPLVVRVTVAPSPLLRGVQESVDVRAMDRAELRAAEAHFSPAEVQAAAEGALARAAYGLVCGFRRG